MFRFLRVLSTFVLALFVSLNAGQAFALNAYVTGNSANLRAQPSTLETVLNRVTYRKAQPHIGKAGSFIKVKSASGAVGYIHSGLLSNKVLVSRSHYAPTWSTPVAVQSRPVWLNIDSSVYHNSGCRWYNNTMYGEFVKVNDAAGRLCQKFGG